MCTMRLVFPVDKVVLVKIRVTRFLLPIDDVLALKAQVMSIPEPLLFILTKKGNRSVG